MLKHTRRNRCVIVDRCSIGKNVLENDLISRLNTSIFEQSYMTSVKNPELKNKKRRARYRQKIVLEILTPPGENMKIGSLALNLYANCAHHFNGDFDGTLPPTSIVHVSYLNFQAGTFLSKLKKNKSISVPSPESRG